MDNKTTNKKKVWLVGHNGLVGSALLRRLSKENYNILTVERSDVDLLNQLDVEKWLITSKPDVVIMCAGKVGGIKANLSSPYDFLYENTTMLANVVNSSFKCNVEKFINISSSCIYPRNVKNPLKEDIIGTGTVEPTNEGYAYSKLIGLKLCEALAIQYNKNFFSIIPTNLYGPNDNFDLETAHVPAALLKKLHIAKLNNKSFVEIWGSGKAIREFMHVDEFADAFSVILKNYNSVKPINVGTGVGTTIKNFAYLVKQIVGYKGKLIFGNENLDGMPSKVLDVKKLQKLGWRSKTNLESGLKIFYQWYEKKLSENKKSNLFNLKKTSRKKNINFL